MKLFSILRKDLQLLFHRRAQMAALFLLPLAFLLVIGFALGPGDGYGIRRGNQMLVLPVADYDGGPRALALLNAAGESVKLEKQYDLKLVQSLRLSEDPSCAQAQASGTPTARPTGTVTAEETPEPTQALTATAEPGAENTVTSPACIEQVGRALLARSQRQAVLIIPPGFSQAVDAGQPVEARLLTDPAADSAAARQIEAVLSGAAVRVTVRDQVKDGLRKFSDLAALAPDEVRLSIAQQADVQAAALEIASPPALRVEKTAPKTVTFRPLPDTYQQAVPGTVVLFVFFIIPLMSSSIRQEKLSGTLRRLLVAPVSRVEMLSSKLLMGILLGLGLVFLLFAAGAAIFKLYLGSDPLAFLLLTIALVSAAASIGLAASTMRINESRWAALLVIAALIGGSIFPIELMPPFLRAVSGLVPHSWAMNGYQSLMVHGLGLQEIFPQIMMLFSLALLFFLIALFRFDFESQ